MPWAQEQEAAALQELGAITVRTMKSRARFAPTHLQLLWQLQAMSTGLVLILVVVVEFVASWMKNDGEV